MIVGLLCLAGAIYLFATKRRVPRQKFAVYFCTIHQDYFSIPVTAKAICPTCFAKFESMERDLAQ